MCLGISTSKRQSRDDVPLIKVFLFQRQTKPTSSIRCTLIIGHHPSHVHSDHHATGPAFRVLDQTLSLFKFELTLLLLISVISLNAVPGKFVLETLSKKCSNLTNTQNFSCLHRSYLNIRLNSWTVKCPRVVVDAIFGHLTTSPLINVTRSNPTLGHFVCHYGERT